MTKARLAVVAALLGSAAAVQARPAGLTVVPGGIVRWPGEGLERCQLDGRSFAPLDGACWYPIDLLAGEGARSLGRQRHGQTETAEVRVGAYPYPEQRLTVPDKQVNLSKKDLARVKRENARVAQLWKRPEGEPGFHLPLRAPLENLPAGGRFGTRRFFNNEPRSPHSGADYAAPTGTPVLAAAPGEVILAEDHFFPGKSVFVDHGGGFFTMYFHLSRMDVKPGQRVAAGDRLGLVGATGRVTGPHLHFAVRWLGARVDPDLLLGPLERVVALPAEPAAAR